LRKMQNESWNFKGNAAGLGFIKMDLPGQLT
jgi:hypothetical protein